jgi:site-specific DNA recombinase
MEACMRAAIYVRVSGENDDRTASLESQSKGCQEWCRKHGIKEWEVFTENKSGFTLERPALEKLREGVRAGRFNRVLVYAVDRLAREQTHTFILLDEFVRHGVELKSCTEEIENTAEGKFMLSVRAFMAEVEREKIRERTMRGKRKVFEAGKILKPGTPKYGFRFGEDGLYHPFEDEAKVIRSIYEWISQGLSTRAVAKKLTEAGIPSPLHTEWQASRIGIMIRCTHYRGEYSTKKNGYRPGVIAGEPIVNAELWTAAVDSLSRRSDRISTGRNATRFLLLRGLVFCECGRKAYAALHSKAATNRKESGYYVCASAVSSQLKKGASLAACGKHRYWAIEALHQSIWDHVRDIVFNEELFRQAYEQATKEDADTGEHERITSEIKKLEQNKKRIKSRLIQLGNTDDGGVELVDVFLAMDRQIKDLRSQIPLAAEKKSKFAEYDVARERAKEIFRNGLGDKDKRIALDELGVKVTISKIGYDVEVFNR